MKLNLLEQLSYSLSKRNVEALAEQVTGKSFELTNLIDLTFHPDQQIGYRAAWILENVYSKYEDAFSADLLYFLGRFKEQHNQSAMRHYAKIFAFITDKKASDQVKANLAKAEIKSLIETVFDWLLDQQTAVAVKSHCLTILANLSIKHHWIKEELLHTIDFLEKKESVAFFAKAKLIKKMLSRS